MGKSYALTTGVKEKRDNHFEGTDVSRPNVETSAATPLVLLEIAAMCL